MLFFHALRKCLFLIVKGVLFTIAGGKGLLLLFRKNPATPALLAIVALVIWFKCDASGPRWMRTAFDSVSNDLKRVVSRGIDAVTPRGSPAADPRWDGPYLFIRESSVPGFPIMVVSMPTRAVCTEFLSQFGQGAAKLSVRCIPNEGQYDSFFRHEPNRDWYVTLQSPGEFETVNIFRSGDPKRMLETVRRHTEKMLELMRQPSSHPCTVHVISPQGEIDIAESTSTIQALFKGDRTLHRATWSERE